MPKKPSPAAGRPDATSLDAALAPGGQMAVMIRETVESVVVAISLAILIRTFAAEPFVIPTGSMSPALLGMHKDVACSECGYRYRVTASSEDPEEGRRRGIVTPRDLALQQVVAGVCPMCRYQMPLRPDLPADAEQELGVPRESIDLQPPYPGDRILVNKAAAGLRSPNRWDVMVFKFPGDGNMSYIKRITGLPGETIRVYQGDLFTRPVDDRRQPFAIVRKDAEQAAAMLQPVHDTDYEPATLHAAGWPLRWAATTPDGWEVAAKPEGELVQQRFRFSRPRSEQLSWIRYRHLLPEAGDWRLVHELASRGDWNSAGRLSGLTQEQWLARIRPELIADLNPYNARVERLQLEQGLDWDAFHDHRSLNWVRLGANWVGDLALECDLAEAAPQGLLALDLVEAGVHFRATFDLAKDRVEFTAIDGRTGEPLDFRASAEARLSGRNRTVRLANVDDQLLLWIDGRPIEVQGAQYDREKLLAGGRKQAIPWVGPEGSDQGDLSPAGIGAQDAEVEITRLALARDIYYIAVDHHRNSYEIAFDYESPRRPAIVAGAEPAPALDHPRDLFADSASWVRWQTRQAVQFDVREGQFFVMGDNSPESKDCRLWSAGDDLSGYPGGAYLDEELLVGKAVCVFWPHSWGGIGFLPGWPNFGDMRMVR